MCKLIQAAGRGEISPAGLHAITIFLDSFTRFATNCNEESDEFNAVDLRARQKALMEFVHHNGLVGVVSLACLPQHTSLVESWCEVTYPCRRKLVDAFGSSQTNVSTSHSEGDRIGSLLYLTLSCAVNIYR